MDLLKIFHMQENYFRAGNTLKIEHRLHLLNQLESCLKTHEEELLDAISIDLNKSRPETMFTELLSVYDEIKLFRKKLRKWAKPQRKRAGLLNFPARAYVNPHPYGNVLLIVPWNYPYRISLIPLVGALAAGNTVIMKMSSRSTASSDLLTSILNAQFPDEVLHVMAPLTDKEEIWEPDYDQVFFTGSVQVGQEIAKICGERMIPYVLELGGKSPAILLDDVDVDMAAKRIVWGKGFNAGQTCIAPDHVYLKKEQEETFIRSCKKYWESFYPDGVSTDRWPKLIDEEHFQRLNKLLDYGDVIFGGEVLENEQKMGLTLIKNVEKESPLQEEEIFGPILPLYTYDDERALIKHLQYLPSPLACYVFTAKERRGWDFLKTLAFGGGCINDTLSHINSNRVPFGGMGQSGIGQYHGKYSFDAFTHPQTIMVKPKWELPIRYPPLPNLWKKDK